MTGSWRTVGPRSRDGGQSNHASTILAAKACRSLFLNAQTRVWLSTDGRRSCSMRKGHRGQLAHGDRPAEYGFTDIDGSRPDVWRYSEAAESGDRDIDPNDYR